MLAAARDVPDYRLAVDLRRRHPHVVDDPYRFLPTLGEIDLHLINEGRHEQLWEVLGARVHHYETPLGDTVTGTSFAVWAPGRARRPAQGATSTAGTAASTRCASSAQSGVWELFVPGVGSGTPLQVRRSSAPTAQWREKADPMAFYAEVPPATVVGGLRVDATRGATTPGWRPAPAKQPVARADVGLRGAPRVVAQARRRDADLRPSSPTSWSGYLTDLGFTHVELMPVMQHPFGGSWGYHVTSYFAPDSRFGDPDGFRLLVDRLHQAGIGVILDWVPGHFATDEWALARFDGTPLYEDPNPQRGWHKEWGSHIFNFGRHEVRNFLYANALYWLEEFHADGLRVDGVASMLYLDYSREEGEWTPNKYGGRENLEAVQFLQEMNATVYKRVPGRHHDRRGVDVLAAASPGRPPSGGLGFGFKWNMGWMHDSLGYVQHDPVTAPTTTAR